MADDKSQEDKDDKGGDTARYELFDITEDNEQLPYEEKLAMFERDAETLYEFALTKGLSANQIRTCFSPILGGKTSLGKRIATDSSRSVIILSVVVALIALLWVAPTSKKIITAHVKLLSVKTIPIWDWTTLYFEDCLINNPFLKEKNFTEDDCSSCIDFNQINSVSEIDMDFVAENLQNDVPFVVTDAVKDWPEDSDGLLLFSLDKLNELFKEHKVLTDATLECEFLSTMDDKNNIEEFLEALQVEDFPKKFHVSWENCDANAAKVFRMLGTRPYFFPSFAEASPYNQVIVARGKFDDDDAFTLPQQVDSASWLIVLDGEMQITLTPHADCVKYKCGESTFPIGPGEAVVVPSSIWNMTYTPISDSYTLGYASTLLWDEV